MIVSEIELQEITYGYEKIWPIIFSIFKNDLKLDLVEQWDVKLDALIKYPNRSRKRKMRYAVFFQQSNIATISLHYHLFDWKNPAKCVVDDSICPYKFEISLSKSEEEYYYTLFLPICLDDKDLLEEKKKLWKNLIVEFLSEHS